MIGGEDLYTRYAEKVYRYLFALCGRADTAEELTQETFCRALAGQKEFRGECAPSTWLCAIAKRVWYQELARGSRTAPLEEAALAGAEEPPEQAEQRLERLELYRALAKAGAGYPGGDLPAAGGGIFLPGDRGDTGPQRGLGPGAVLPGQGGTDPDHGR